MPTEDQITRSAPRRHRPGAAQEHRRRSGWSGRSTCPTRAASTWWSRSTTPGCPIRAHFENGVAESVGALDGVSAVNVGFDVLSRPRRSRRSSSASAAGRPAARARSRRVKNVICVGSGKGGVGKSTVTANLAAALQAEGKQRGRARRRRVGLLDPAHARRARPADGLGRSARSSRSRSTTACKVISIEFFLEGRDQAITWRGPMLHKAIRQFLEDVDWGELDYLLIDLPPGTGDVSMTLAQLLPQAKFVVVTTPQPAAQKVAKRAAETAQPLRPRDRRAWSRTCPASPRRAASASRSSARAAASSWPTSSTCRCSARSRSRRSSAMARRRGPPARARRPDAPASQALFHAARGLIAVDAAELAVFQAPSGPARAGMGTACRWRHRHREPARAG